MLIKIANVEMLGLLQSIRAAKLPFAEPEGLTDELTPIIKRCAQCPTGAGEDNFLNGIVVQFDLTASLKMWPQLQRYHFVDFVSSQSTMHCISRFDPERHCNCYVDPRMVEALQQLIAEYNADKSKDNFRRLIYSIPTGFRLTARLTTNYRQLKTIYKQRHKHRLPEWREFCDWVETLPMSELITGEGADEHQAGTEAAAQ